MDFNGLLDAYTYNERTPAGKRRYEQQRAQAYSDVWGDVESELGADGNSVDHHPMRTAEILLRSGNPTAIKTGEAMLTQYHAGKTGDTKEFEYGLTLDDSEKDEWLRRNVKAGKDVIGTSVKVRRNDGSVGYSVVRNGPNGPYMQDLGANAYVEEKIVQLGGGSQGVYRDGRNGGQPQQQPQQQGPAPAPQGVDPQQWQAFQQFQQMQAQHLQQAGQTQQAIQGNPIQPGAIPNVNQSGGQVPGVNNGGGMNFHTAGPQQGAPGPQTQPRPTPRAVPQQPTTVPQQQGGGTIRGVTPVNPIKEFASNAQLVEQSKALGKQLGVDAGKVRSALLPDMKTHQNLEKAQQNIIPEINSAIALIDKDGLLQGGNWATGGIMTVDYLRDLFTVGFLKPGQILMPVEKRIGSDSQKLHEHLNVIRTNVAFDRLQEMRAANETGGALGQISDMENQMLKDSLASLNQHNTPDVMISNLTKVAHHYDKVVKLNKINFLVKHKYKINDSANYDEFVSAQVQAIIDVYGMTPEAEAMIDKVESFR